MGVSRPPPDMDTSGALEVGTLLKVILVLVVVWLVIEVAGSLLRLTMGLFRFLPTIIGALVVVLIVLWLLDRI